MTTTQHVTETAWCPTCRRRQSITETFQEAFYLPHGEQEYTVTLLACDHHLESEPVTARPAPGAPYAGPQAQVAGSLRDCRTWAGLVASLPAPDPWATEADAVGGAW